MSARPGLRGLVSRTIRRPGAAAQAARTQKLRAFLVVTDAVPARIRSTTFGMVGRVADLALRRRGDHPVAAPARAIATALTSGDRAAMSQARSLARTASPRTAARLARFALAAGDPAAAERIVAMHPSLESDRRSVVLRGEIAYQLGYYATAVAALAPVLARRPSDGQVRHIVERSKAELAMLDPAWRADLGSAGRATQTLKNPVPGRILHLLTNSLPYRQAGYTVRAQSVGLAQLAQVLDPHMVTRAGFPLSDGVRNVPADDAIDGVAYHRLKPDLEPGLAIDRIATETARALVPLITRLRPALLQPTTNYINAQVALDLGERFDIPVVYEVRGFLEETWLSRIGAAVEASDRYRGAREVETASMRRAAAVVTLSETMRADILTRGGIAPDRVTVIPNAVDLERFTPGPRDAALAAQLGIDAGETVVGYISSFTAYEGIGFLIQAVALLRRRGRRVRLLLVGDGEERSKLEAIAAETGLRADGGVIFTGRVPHADVERYYRTIDVFVVPRTNDRVSRLVTPLKPYEAMAMQKALVVSDVGALLEIVEDDVTGRSFRAEDAASLANVVEALVDDAAARERLGAAAREWVAANRTWAQNGRRYVELYQRLGAV